MFIHVCCIEKESAVRENFGTRILYVISLSLSQYDGDQLGRGNCVQRTEGEESNV